MKKIVLAAVAVFAAVAAPVGAQFQAMSAPNNDGTPFWDNSSDDGANCNVGYVLTGVAGSAGNSCSNQRPSTWLPYTGTAPTAYWGTAGGGWLGFVITPGTYSFSLLPGTTQSGGDVAGDDDDWGYFTFDGGGGRTTTSLNGGLPGAPVVFTTYWGLWIDMSAGAGMAYSDLDPQFSAFAYDFSSVIFGIEDTELPGGDQDYNDELFQIAIDGGGRITEVIPEPMTMTLLATGLAGMAAASRRRRAKK